MTNRLVSVGDDFTLPAAVKAADANLPARLQTAALGTTYAPALGASAYVPRTSQRVIVIGDSIDQGADSGATFFGGSWASQLAVRTNQKFHLVRNSGIGGQTTTQIAARFQADVLAHNPGIVVIGGSTNDRNGNMAGGVAQTKANFIAMAAQAKAAGVHVVVRTAPPTDVAGGGTLNTIALNRAAVDNFNAWLKIWARQNLIPVIDLHKHWVDQTTGGWKTGYTSDGIHPTPAALLIAVEGVKAELPSIFNGSVDLLVSNADASSLSTNPLLLTDSNIDGIPDSWYFPDFAAITLSTAAAGKWVEVNSTTAAKYAYAAASPLLAVTEGDVVSVAGKVKATTVVGATIQLQDQNNATVATPMNNWVGEITDGTFYMEYTIGAGITRVQAVVNASATGGKVSVSQLTVRNRTKLGV